MKLRSHRRDLVLWSSSAGPARYGAPRFTRPARTRPIRRWIRTSVLLAVIGLMHVARTVRTRWRPALLLAGGVLTMAGNMLSSSVVLLPGLLILLIALLIGSDLSTAFGYGVWGLTRPSAAPRAPLSSAQDRPAAK